MRDPRGYITSPPSAVVKVIGTARDDINGLLGIAISYNIERERYLVHMTDSQSTMALKKENLAKANMIESYRCQFQQLQNDPRVREKVVYYVSVCRQYVHPFDLSKIVGAICLVWLFLLFRVGIAHTIMISSLMLLILVIIAPDIFAKSSPQLAMKNFPNRAKETLEQQIPVLKGKLTARGATGIIMLLVAICFQSLVTTGIKMQAPNLKNVVSAKMEHNALKQYYNLGFEDATKGLAHGTSLQDDSTISALVEEGRISNFNDVEPGVIAKFVSVTTLASIFFIYKSVIELGMDQTTGLFSAGQLAANLQHHTQLWKKGLLLMSLYNIVRCFI